jgi:hypothetical protein
MSSLSAFRTTLGLLLIGAAACSDRDAASLAGPVTPEKGQVAFLQVSSKTPNPGERIEVSINALRAANESKIGSYTFRVSFDTTALRFVEAGKETDGMVMANRVSNAILVAGASGSGFTASHLATLRFDVVDPRAIETLSLAVVDLTATDFASQARTTVVDSRFYQSSAR